MRILIADDQALFRDALRVLLEDHGHDVVAEATDCPEAVELAAKLRPDVVLLDLCDPITNVTSTTRSIAARSPKTAVIVLTDHPNQTILLQAIAAGAKGYLTKELDGDQFCALLTRVERGEPALTHQLASKLLQAYVNSGKSPTEKQDPSGLTDRERDVLDAMAQGITSNRELSATLHVSENTVRFHIRNILDKLNLHTRAAAIAFALTHGIVEGKGS